MRSSFAAGAVSIAMTVAGTAAARAADGDPWPGVPSLSVPAPPRPPPTATPPHAAYLCHLTARGDDIARFAERRFARIDENGGGRHKIVVQLAPVGTGRANGVDVGPRREPASLQDGRRRARGDDHHVGAAYGIRRTRHRLDPMSFRKCRRVAGTPH